jgi:hypothetical protein
MSNAMPIQQGSPNVNDECPTALLAGAEIKAAHVSRNLKIDRHWSGFCPVPRPRRKEKVDEE